MHRKNLKRKTNKQTVNILVKKKKKKDEGKEMGYQVEKWHEDIEKYKSKEM